ncbi:MAG: pyridoxamine 5'-phosphate oxidase family protein [Cyanobacteria bacterium J06638_28]
MLSDEVLRYIDQSVLCWLATVDTDGWPTVSPKEVFAALDDTHIIIANIASPGSVRNIRMHPPVCVSFIDILTQRGFKVRGIAHLVLPSAPEFAAMVEPLEHITQGAFRIHCIISVEAQHVTPIMAPSYHLIPGTTENSQRRSAMETYGVQPQSS